MPPAPPTLHPIQHAEGRFQMEAYYHYYPAPSSHVSHVVPNISHEARNSTPQVALPQPLLALKLRHGRKLLLIPQFDHLALRTAPASHGLHFIQAAPLLTLRARDVE